jgi:peptide/nickel transport system substrate-binding protein
MAGCAGGNVASPAARSANGGMHRANAVPTQAVMIVRVEVPSVSQLPVLGLAGGGSVTTTTKRLFNANLVVLDTQGAPQPYLAETVPELNQPSWRVEPDGTMETTYRLKPNLTWHDGAPLTAEDFVFAAAVYGTPALGVSGSPPWNLLDRATAPDARTLVLRWSRSFPEAGALTEIFPPLPRHVLAQPFQESAPDAFANHPYWNAEYVGAGPYKVERWEPGAFIEAVAFEGHALGRPRIDRFKITVINDRNTVLATMLAGNAHLAADSSLLYEEGVTLQREWVSRGGGGNVVNIPGSGRITHVQLRPDYVNPRAVLDLRVRRALAHTIDRDGLNDALFDRQGLMTDSYSVPMSPNYPAVTQAIRKYPFDPRAADALMAEAGFTRGSDGVYTGEAEGKLAPELMVPASSQGEREMAIMASVWRQVGFDIQERVLPARQMSEGEARSTYRSLQTSGGGTEKSFVQMHSRAIPTPANRWSGNNRGGWSNAAFDRLAEAYETTLDRGERAQRMAEMARLVSDDVPVFPLYFNFIVIAHAARLQGPRLVAPDTEVSWNVHTWELR